MKTEKFFIELTDTFGGEANFSWVRRYSVSASSFRGAVTKLAREFGAGWKLDYHAGDFARYNLKNACICCFVYYFDVDAHSNYSGIVEI